MKKSFLLGTLFLVATLSAFSVPALNDDRPYYSGDDHFSSEARYLDKTRGIKVVLDEIETCDPAKILSVFNQYCSYSQEGARYYLSPALPIWPTRRNSKGTLLHLLVDSVSDVFLAAGILGACKTPLGRPITPDQRDVLYLFIFRVISDYGDDSILDVKEVFAPGTYSRPLSVREIIEQRSSPDSNFPDKVGLREIISPSWPRIHLKRWIAGSLYNFWNKK